MNFEHGSDTFILIFRNYFYLFTQRNQDILYSYAYFLIKWINTMVRKNKNIIYFIPRLILDIPFEMFKLLYKIRSSSLYNKDHRQKVNLQSPHFNEDKFTYEIAYFYTLLFSDMNIANPEIRESLIYKIKFLMKKKKTSELFEKHNELIDFLIKGLLKYMTIESLSHIACEIMVKIVKPICFGPMSGQYEKTDLVIVAQKFFENNISTFHDFMDNYTKLINKIMTDYTIVLNEAANVSLYLTIQRLITNVNSNIEYIENKQSLLKRLMFAYNILCDLMKIFEFLLNAYPDEFIDVDTLNYSRFCNFLKNISSRVLEKHYFNQLVTIFEKENIRKGVV
jgi:hypothetical protein